jgi:HAD superfamily hydrolase (TIGR01549 family)
MTEVTTILFDIGWPIIDETEAHRNWNRRLRNLIKSEKRRIVSDAEIREYESEAVACYAPSMFSYVIWRLVKPDRELFRRFRAEFDSGDYARDYRLQPDIHEVLERLQGKFKLGFAANQPKSVYHYLETEGVLKYFTLPAVSAEIGYSKPDVRMFLRVLENLNSRPEESLMIGDRQDNDIVPAKMVGMKTVRFLIGPYKDQIIRLPKEEPDYTITRLSNIPNIPLISSRL